jgi:hypothetical protein
MTVRLGTRSAQLERPQAQLLFSRAQSLQPPMGETSSAEAPAKVPDLQLTILSQDQTVATLTLWANTMHWQVPGQPQRQGQLSDAQAQDLLRLAGQALDAAQVAPQ